MSLINLTATEVAALLEQHKIVLVDVREPQEFLAERIEGALLFPLSSFNPAHLPSVTPERPLVFHCGAGVRSAKAAALCMQAGHAEAYHLAGGFGAWKQAQLPYLKFDPSSGQVCAVC